MARKRQKSIGSYIAPILLLVTVVHIAAKSTFVRLQKTDAKLEEYVFSTFENLTVVMCIMKCKQHSPKCLTINYHELTRSCELSSFFSWNNLISAVSWKTYIFTTQFYYDPCETNPCASDQVCVKYFPFYHVRYNPDRDGEQIGTKFVCMKNPWIVAKYNSGKTDCSFDALANFHVPGGLIVLPDSTFTYGDWTTFQKCSEFDDCNTIVCEYEETVCVISYVTCEFESCVGGTEKCFMKRNSPIANGAATAESEVAITWYLDCSI